MAERRNERPLRFVREFLEMRWGSRLRLFLEFDMDTLSRLSSIEFIGDSLWTCDVDQSGIVPAVLSKLVVVSFGLKQEDSIGTFLDAPKLTLTILELCILAKMDNVEAA